MSPLMTEDELKRLVEETAEAGKDRAAALRRALDAELSRRQAAEREVERLREALEPFARVAGPIKGEDGRPTYLDEIMRGKGTEELAVTTIFDTGGRGAVLWADDFRRARQSLQGTGEANPNPKEGETT
jgi:hypothetical protein